MPLEGDYVQPKTPWVADQLATIEETGDTRSVDMQGRPIVVFTMRGAKSNKLHRVPLMRVEHDGAYLAVASKGGAPEHPDWYHNIVANPHVEVHDGTEHRDLVARELTGAERETWWERAVEAFPPYAEYQVKTDRQIPVLLCETVAG